VRPKKILTITAVLAVVLLGTDRAGKLAAERIGAGRMQTALSTATRPTLDVGDFPFLPDLVRRKFSHVTVDIRDASGGKVVVAHIHADLHDVAPEGSGLRAGSITGEGNITYAALSKASAPLRIGFGGPGLIQITAPFKVLGRELTASASGAPRIEGNTFIIKPERAATSLTGDAGQAAEVVPEVRVPLRDMPRNLKMVLNPTEDGIDFSFSGSDVLLSGGHSSAEGTHNVVELPSGRTEAASLPVR
jgi:hypothetical protein